MPDQEQHSDGYSRKRQALYLTGLLPDDEKEARAVLELCAKLLNLLAPSDGQGRAK